VLLYQVYFYIATPKSQMEQHTLVHKKTLLNNHMCHSLIVSTKWLFRLYCIYI